MNWNRSIRSPLALSVLFTAACETGPAPEPALSTDQTARAAVRDATHGGDPGFHWLPPIVAMATTDGTFDGTQFPSIRVENYSTRVIIDTIPSEEITVLGDRYTWDWDTSQYTINLANTYRLSVIVRNRVIGYADVRLYAVGTTISPIRNTVQIFDGTTLSVAFHLNQCAPVVCTALDDCHVKGVCQPASGECTNPIGRNGRRCDDENSCTTGDVCMAGTCVGATTLGDGTECDDDDACTQTDTCQAGTCVGDDEVECEARDQCHEAGECESTFGLCSEPAAPEGQGCDDGNACTLGDSCEHGSCVPTTLAICYAIDECHLAGSCNPITGCSTPLRPDSTPCNADNDRCTRDHCEAGVCTVGDPVICAAGNACQEAGICNPASGRCSSASRPDGTLCDDDNACTQDDFCRNGVCRPGEELECTALDACHRPGTCDRGTGLCSNPNNLDGTACSDLDACTLNDECRDGVCESGVSLTCLASDDCHIAAACDPDLGCVDDETPADDGSECDDNNLCTTGEACFAGTCTGGVAVDGCVENSFECEPALAGALMPPPLPAAPAVANNGPSCTVDGRIYVAPGESASYSGCVVSGNNIVGYGGGVYVEPGGRLTLTDVIVRDNTATDGGGGIYNAGDLTLIRVRLENNFADWGGGLLQDEVFLPVHFGAGASGPASLNAVDLTVIGNEATCCGAGLYLYGGTAAIRTVSIENNGPSYWGAGFENDAFLTLTNATITGNYAIEDPKNSYAGQGGGFYNWGTLTIDYGLVDANTAARDGGGAFNESTMTLTDTPFLNNTAGGAGGGIFNLDGTIEARGGAAIRGNQADGALESASAQDVDCLAPLQGVGGGLANTGTFTFLGGTPFEDNVADQDGGAIWSTGTVRVVGGSVGGNIARRNGGGVYNAGDFIGSALGVGTCDSPTGNTAGEDGGGFYNMYGLMSLVDSSVQENSAGQHGGGLYNVFGASELTRTTFLSNTAVERGGGIANCGGSIGGPNDFSGYSAENLTIVGNTAGSSGGGIDTRAGGYVADKSGACAYATCGPLAADVTGIDIWGAPYTYTACPGSGYAATAYTTIADNSAPLGAGIYADPEEDSNSESCGLVGPSLAEMRATLIGRSLGSNCDGPASSFISLGYNNEDANACNLSHPQDITGIDTGLGSLAGAGLAPAIPLNAGSIAIDRIPCTIGTPGGYGGYGAVGVTGGGSRRFGILGGADDPTVAPPTDERGVGRPQPFGGNCDVGAYEANDGTVFLTAIVVSPASCGPAVGESTQFTATAVYSDGSSVDVTNSASWSGSASVSFFGVPGYAYFDQPGGPYTVSASLGGLTGTLDGYAWGGGISGEPCDDLPNGGNFVTDWGDERWQGFVSDLAMQDDGKLLAFVQFHDDVRAFDPSSDDQATCESECTAGVCLGYWYCNTSNFEFPDEASCIAACEVDDVCESGSWRCFITTPSPGNAVARFNTDGSLDLSFNGGISHDPGAKFQSSTQTVQGIPEPTDPAQNPAARGGLALSSAGSIYASAPGLGFWDSGSGINVPTGTDLAGATIAVHPSSADPLLIPYAGKIVAFNANTVTRYNPDGTLDLTFGIGGTSEPGPSSFASGVSSSFGIYRSSGVILPNGKILLGGAFSTGETTQPGFVRFNPDGTLDTTYGSGGVLSCPHQNNVQGFNTRLTYDEFSGRTIAVGVAYVPTGFTGQVDGGGGGYGGTPFSCGGGSGHVDDPVETCDDALPELCAGACGSGVGPVDGANIPSTPDVFSCAGYYPSAFFAVTGSTYNISTLGNFTGDTYFVAYQDGVEVARVDDCTSLGSAATFTATADGFVDLCAGTYAANDYADWDYQVTSDACGGAVNLTGAHVSRGTPARFGAGGGGGAPIESNGDAVVGVVVLDADQACDTAFNATGVRAEPFVPDVPGGDDVATGVDTTCDGRIVVGGWSQLKTYDFDNYWGCSDCNFYKYFVMVFNYDGTLDTTFNAFDNYPGKKRFFAGPYQPSYNDMAWALTVDPLRGRIYVGGWTPHTATANSDGTPIAGGGATCDMWTPCSEGFDCVGGFCVDRNNVTRRITAVQCINLGGVNAALPD